MAKAVETRPDAWELLESAVHEIVPPKRGKPMMAMGKIRVVADASALEAAFSDFEPQALTGLSERTPEIFDALIDPLGLPDELARIEIDTTFRAGEVRVRFNPSDRLLGLMTAIRIGNVERFAIKD